MPTTKLNFIFSFAAPAFTSRLSVLFFVLGQNDYTNETGETLERLTAITQYLFLKVSIKPFLYPIPFKNDRYTNKVKGNKFHG